MPEKAKVFIAEDDADFLDTLRPVLEDAGHTITFTADSLESALSAIGDFKRLGIQVAIVDGNLNPNVRSGTDGRQLVNTIRRLSPDVRIIGMSSGSIPNVDVDLGKQRFEEVGKVVTAL